MSGALPDRIKEMIVRVLLLEGVTPADITKTVYRAMGIHDLEAFDNQGRPYSLLAEGEAIAELSG